MKKYVDPTPSQPSAIAMVGLHKGQYHFRPAGMYQGLYHWNKQGYSNERLAADAAIRAGFAAAKRETDDVVIARRGPIQA